jgi:hypothetical protein
MRATRLLVLDTEALRDLKGFVTIPTVPPSEIDDLVFDPRTLQSVKGGEDRAWAIISSRGTLGVRSAQDHFASIGTAPEKFCVSQRQKLAFEDITIVHANIRASYQNFGYALYSP